MSQTDDRPRSFSADQFETRVVHAGFEPDPTSGAVVPPIQLSTTFKQDSVGELRDGYDYARTDNPTRRVFEKAIADLEGGGQGIAYASGMAATQNVLYLLDPGDRIIVSDDVYGGTWRLAEQVWRRYGIHPVPMDLRDLDALAAELNPSATAAASTAATSTAAVRMVWVETPTNPLLKVIDISAVVRLAAAAGALVVVDNTFATPFLQRPLELGADIALHSATKYLGGHSDVVGGMLVTRRDDLAERLRFHQNAAGAVPSPFDCWLVLRGMRTLALRMERACANAALLAAWLTGRPEVARVHYPGLPDHPQRELMERQMRLPGAMVSFEVADGAGGAARAAALAGCTRIFTLAESLGAVESLIEVPAAMTHQSVAETPLAVPASLVRLSVGIESADDLVADLDAAFASSASV
jgi:cystathionine gamma-synthase